MKAEVLILHHEYPARIRDHVVAKLQHLVRFFEGTISLRAVLERQHDMHRVEVVANVRRGVVLVVDARADRVIAALDQALDRMGRALARHKGKLRENRRRGRAR
jgi:ribosomal subunit interface protein